MEIKHTDPEDIRNMLKQILDYIGDDSDREGLLETPERIRKSWNTLFIGYEQNPQDVFKIFTEGSCDEMVILKDIEFYSTCEHHFLPFFGKIHIGYIPNNKVIGISKLARLVEVYSRRLQIQERLVGQIADDLMKYLECKGCIVIAEAQHMCMTARGVQKQNSKMLTNAVTGMFKDDPKVKDEFLSMIK